METAIKALTRIKSYDKVIEFYQTVVQLHVSVFWVPFHVAGSLVQHTDNRAVFGVVFPEEILPAAPATVVVVFGEGAFQVGSAESVRARSAGNSSRGAGKGFSATDRAARLHDSGRQLPGPPRYVLFPRSTQVCMKVATTRSAVVCFRVSFLSTTPIAFSEIRRGSSVHYWHQASSVAGTAYWRRIPFSGVCMR